MNCLVCNQIDVGYEDSYYICSVCGRENDSWGVKDNEYGGANYFTVNDHRMLWKLYGTRKWEVDPLYTIDCLASFIEEDFGIVGITNGISKPLEEYRMVVEECVRLLSQPDFNINSDIERRVCENPTTRSAKFWLSIKNSRSK